MGKMVQEQIPCRAVRHRTGQKINHAGPRHTVDEHETEIDNEIEKGLNDIEIEI